jgi:SAM-dependent methyltransferase
MSIPKEKVKSYWGKRSSEQGPRTVGFANGSMENQDKEYDIHRSFVFPYLNKEAATLDYGCGIGRYTDLYNENNYIGADITQRLLDIAMSNHPDHSFVKLDNVGDIPDVEFDVFFTATVLQHNSDETVDLIFSNLRKIKSKNLQFILYENNHAQCYHVKKRSSSEYLDIVSNYFQVKSFEGSSHIIRGEKHDISKIQT